VKAFQIYCERTLFVLVHMCILAALGLLICQYILTDKNIFDTGDNEIYFSSILALFALCFLEE
jgi:hypothetical protein